MKIVALEIENEVYKVEVADIFSTNDELKASMIVDFREEDAFDKFKSKKATAHGVFLGQHIVIPNCDMDFETGYEDGLCKVFLYGEELDFTAGNTLKKITDKIPSRF